MHQITTLLLVTTISLSALFIGISCHDALAQSQYSIPNWIRIVAGWWSQGQVGDDEFVKGMQYLIQNNIIKNPHGQEGRGTPQIPNWIRIVAGWWSQGQVSDDEFVMALQWLINNNILVVPEAQQSQNMTSSSDHRMIATFAPHINDTLLSVFDKHKTEFGINFRISNLQVYDSQQRILLGFSSDSVNSAIQQAANSGVQIQYVGYDNEPNNANLSTPPDEVADPATVTNQLANTVHNAGFKYAITPSRDLLQLEYQNVDWTKVDLIVIQMQRITGNGTQYHGYLDPIVSYIKIKNPHTMVLVQVNPGFDSISHIVSVIDGTYLIDGVSIVVTTATVDQIDELLTALGR